MNGDAPNVDLAGTSEEAFLRRIERFLVRPTTLGQTPITFVVHAHPSNGGPTPTSSELSEQEMLARLPAQANVTTEVSFEMLSDRVAKDAGFLGYGPGDNVPIFIRTDWVQYTRFTLEAKDQKRRIHIDYCFNLSTKKSPCFIATAAYGSDEIGAVKDLQAYREAMMRASSAGRFLIRVYERVSPPIARGIAASKAARFVVRACIVRPAACWARRMLAIRTARSGYGCSSLETGSETKKSNST